MPDPKVVRHTEFAPLFKGECLDEAGQQTACCMWQPQQWVPPAQIAVGLTLMWTLAIRTQLRTYVIGGVITQWCVSPCMPPMHSSKTADSTCALYHANSHGPLCGSS